MCVINRWGSVEFIEVTFKDQFVTGSEMWALRCAVVDNCAYTQKKLSVGNMRVRSRPSPCCP